MMLNETEGAGWSPTRSPDSPGVVRADGPANRGLRVLVANEPRSYREAIAATIAILRPLDEVTEVEPDSLAAEVRRLSPHLIICSRLIATGETGASWVELYSGGDSRVVTSFGGEFGGEQTTLPEMSLEQLLAFTERTRRLVESRSKGCAPLPP